MLLGEPWVLYRADGRIVAFADRCPHRRTPLSLGHCQAGVLRCAYHGWRFDAAGACVEIPALGPRAPLPPAARLSPPAGLVEAHGIVFLAPEDPIAPLGSIPEADDPSFEAGELPTIVARASAGLLADNFLDVAHFPFVHTGTFGATEEVEVAHVCRRPRRVVLHRVLRAFVRQSGGPGRGGGRATVAAGPPAGVPAQCTVPPPAADRLPRRRRVQRDRVLHPARDGGLVPPLHHAVARRPLRTTRRAWPTPSSSRRRCCGRTCGFKRRSPSWSCRWHREPRSTPAPTGRHWSCGGVLSDLVVAAQEAARDRG